MATTEERDIFANEYVQIYTNGSGNIVLLFQNEVEKTLAIGEQMNEINEEAYMNGYNWDAFFNYYLAENAPDILESMESDPEAGSYAAYFEDTAENEQKAKRFADIIISLIENEEEIYKILREKGDEIEWD
ncbi:MULTISPECIES: Imm51 family immunity protein [Bacteroidales]|jgi:hypothetical protein|uniref:Imm51 family immunity protein n=1 Tax=Bacteroidales TaxID=171549 RepID=UPI001896DF10|nr:MULTISPECIES: Imm51 family immunity protein [Bacteroidales]MBS6469630.1 hypothetical protein [Bacteroides sp.]MBT9662051.1 hypothetical protein [Odoribacter splanchnicus]MCE8896695.1 immunity 51 family protein [Parabacteroides distasonis]MCL1617020.1 immunity 51 family protein [Bacteroides sp. ET71]MDB8881879.1 Imm51 family immunity protein [Parabacteroides merdae]